MFRRRDPSGPPTTGEGAAWDSYPHLSKRRLAASRRRTLGVKARRLLPPLVVGATTLAGLGGLVAWVSNQPGVRPVTTLNFSSASLGATPAATSTDPTAAREAQVLAAVGQQLAADNKALQALQSTVTQAAAARRTAGPPASSPGTAFALTPLATIPAVAIPGPVAAPVVNATTGASHAIP